METKYQYRYTVPPKVSYFYRVVNGKETRIKLVRDSLICRLTSKGESVIFGHTIYARALIVNKRVFNRALEKLKLSDKIGKWQYLWNQVKGKFKK